MAQNEGTEGVRATRVAGTPSTFVDVADARTLDSLEFTAALDAVAAHAASAPGAAAVRRRRPSARVEAIREALAAVGRLADLLRAGDPFRSEPIDDLSDTFRALAPAGAVLDGPALAHLGRSLIAERLVAEGLDRLAAVAPEVAHLREDIPPVSLERALTTILDPDGEIPDGAHAAVDGARRAVRDARTRVVERLARVLRTLEAHEAPADAAVTVRRGRYVIPVASGARARVPGIVHEESSSGATLFVEPQAAVELGNALATAERNEARVVHGVLRDLTEQARVRLDAVRSGWEMCVRVDDLYARARYAVEVEGAVPRMVEPLGPFVLRSARHPLLLAEGVPAVPFDLELEPHERGVVVSGPNTGGKTVLLKAVGLASALTQSGVVPPLAEGSVLPVAGRILADIGDHQSIEASLSTFSAHVAALTHALAAAAPGTLVLLDEVGSGTDPREGAALAAAALARLVADGARVVATTHLSELKQLSGANESFVNASLEFDGVSLSPTFRFAKGVPGRSYGLVIARRHGVPDEVLQAAEARIPEEERALDALLADVERRAARLAEIEAEVDVRRALADRDAETVRRRAEDVERRERDLQQREKSLEREGRAQARRFLLDARRLVEEALTTARATVTEATAREARRLVEEGITREAGELKRLEDELRRKGWTVRGSRGTAASPASALSTPPHPAARAGGAGTDFAVEASAEIDLRGLDGEEARAAVVRALDAAVLADLPLLRIIHGKGTGRLRQVVQDLLGADRRVGSYRLAPPHDGGTGVTIAELLP